MKASEMKDKIKKMEKGVTKKSKTKNVTSKKIKKPEYDFSIRREELHREDGTDTGKDVIYRKDNGEQLSIISRQYQLVPHKTAANEVLKVLDKNKIKYDDPLVRLTNNGARLDMEIMIPSMRFPVKVGDEFDPKIIIKNSYDKTHSYHLVYGVNRLTCSNGAKIFDSKFEMRNIHIYNNINFDNLEENIMNGIEGIAKKMKQQYKKLMQMDGLNLLKALLIESKKFKHRKRFHEAIKEQFETDEGIKIKYTRNPDDGNLITRIKASEKFNAYILWNIFTAVVSHNVNSIRTRRYFDDFISKDFLNV
jgi:hypothetical protein